MYTSTISFYLTVIATTTTDIKYSTYFTIVNSTFYFCLSNSTIFFAYPHVLLYECYLVCDISSIYALLEGTLTAEWEIL